MEDPLLRLLTLFRSVKAHGCYWQLLFLVGRFSKKSSLLKFLSQMNRNFTSMEDQLFKIGHFVSIHLENITAIGILVSGCSI